MLSKTFYQLWLSFIIFVSPLLLLSRAYSQSNIDIIPAPLSVKKQNGEFMFSSTTKILADRKAIKAVNLLKSFLVESGKITSGKPKTAIVLTDKGAKNFAAEGYQLEITPSRIIITGRDTGLYYGVQSLLQLFPLKRSGVVKLPCMLIEDRPRFGHRGLMLDVARHFFSVAEIKKLLDQMAAYKLNTFQWHLTDNQGWRIQIKKYPKLTAVGAYRDLTLYGGNRDWPDSLTYGGYYTQEEIKDVVRYAAERYITVIPEIEMPGHSGAALRAYPELKCESPQDPKKRPQYDIIYCPTEQTFAFLEDVLTEVMALFPGKYIHIGGDEAWKLPWRESVFCQKLIQDLKLKDDKGLQSYFIQRMEKFINAKGRSIIGWDEILEGGLAPNATVMSWRGEAGGIAAAKQKHRVIMSPSSGGLYLDYYQSISSMEPFNYSGYAPLWKTYSYNPLPAGLSKTEQAYIAGVQANIWTEGIATPAKLQYMYLPRMLALSEVAWSELKNKNFKNFSEIRLGNHLAKFDALGYNYRVPEAYPVLDTTIVSPNFTFILRNPVPGAKIFYTLNGRTPGDTDEEYAGPVTLKVPLNEKRELQTLVITPRGRRSVATRAVVFNQAGLPAVKHLAGSSGLKYKLFKGAFSTTAQLQYAAPSDSGIISTPSVEELKKRNPSVGLLFEGYVDIVNDDVYNFYLSSDGGAQLLIDNQMVVDNDKPHLKYERNGAISLEKGLHKIKVTYFSNSGPGTLKIFIQAAGAAKQELSAAALLH